MALSDSEEQQLYVVERLAEMAPKWKVVQELKTLYDLSVTPQSLTIYDPTTETGRTKLSANLKAHFAAHRKAFLEDRSGIGLAHANYRLRRLQELIDHELYGLNPEFVKSVVEMAEKIEGGLYRVRFSEAEALALVAERGVALRAAVDEIVSDPKQRDKVHAQVQKIVQGEGGRASG